MKMETVMEEGEEYSNLEDSEWTSDLDVSQLCRICANPNEYLIPIFHGEGLEHELKVKIKKHLPIKVTENDKLPTHLCYQCASTLIAWHDMVVGCLEADEKLKSIISKDDAEDCEMLEDATAGEDVAGLEDVKDDKSAVLSQIARKTAEADLKTLEMERKRTEDETERLIVEEEVTTEPAVIEEVATDSRQVVEVTEDSSMETEEPVVTAVEVYEDVETTVVLHDFGEDLEEGQYIAYIDEEFIETSRDDSEHSKILIVSDSKPFVCEECNQVFTNLTLFKNHIRLSHKGRRHFCDDCGANYKRFNQLEKHVKAEHPDAVIDHTTKEYKKSSVKCDRFACNQCTRVLKSQVAFENHILKHQSKFPFQCSVCSETFANRGARRKHEVRQHNLLIKENGDSDGYHVCDLCGQETFSEGSYYSHKDKHRDPYQCGFCGKLFDSKGVMLQHVKRHTTEKTFFCTLCTKSFKGKQELTNHMNTHLDLRPYQCPHCPKALRKSSDLIHHVRTHTGEKPNICDQCGRGFAQAGDMRKHRQLHFRPSKINKPSK